jgi:hypothetical protein
MSQDSVNLHRIWNETSSRLESLSKRVAENRDVMPALEFARFVIWSGICELLEANSSDGPLKVDGSHLRWQCRELQTQCTERFRLNDSEPHIEALQLQSIHEKINTLAGYLSKLVVAGPAVVQSSEPELKILPGGLDDPERGDQVVRAVAEARTGD